MSAVRTVKLATRRALVVAHPDDEALWFAGLVVRLPGPWTVICCSLPTRDPERGWQFYDSCERLGVLRALVVPFTESIREPLRPDVIARVCERINRELEPHEVVVTHGPRGEYGHPHHRQLSAQIRHPRVICSAYGEPPVQPEDRVALSDAEWSRKLSALRCYDGPMMHNRARMPTHEALLDEFGSPAGRHKFDLTVEPYREREAQTT